jgi:hypothetical protein
MGIRPEVLAFAELGPLPASSADETVIARHESLLHKIKKPVSDQEAALLVTLFGADDCYGLAWALLHLVETAPGGIPAKAPPNDSDNEWVRRLWARSHRG